MHDEKAQKAGVVRAKRIPLSELLRVLKTTRGNVTRAAESLGVSRELIHRRVGLDTIQQIRQDADNWRVDIALVQLDKALLMGERWAVEKILNSRAGYGDQQNHAVTIVKIIEGVDETKL